MSTRTLSPSPGSVSRTGEIPRLSRWVVGIAAAVAVVHVVVNLVTPYELHRDAYLYLAMGRHLRPWRMDFPPLIGMIAQAERGLFGDSLASIRLSSTLAHAANVVLAGLIARELGGRRWAQGLAALAVAVDPLFLRPGALFQPVVLDQLWWTVGLFALARMARREPGDAPREWLLLGVACGLGLLTKFSILFFGMAVLVGTLLSERRRDLATPWPWLAAAIAFAMGAPSVVGQIRLGWPVLGQMRDLQDVQLQRVTAGDFLAGQLFMLGPWILLAAAGLIDLLVARRRRPWRSVGWACLAAFVLLLVLHGKPYYVGPIYPALLAAGAALLERATSGRDAYSGPYAPPRSRIAAVTRTGVVALGLLSGAVFLPLGLPILPPPQMALYSTRMGITQAVTTNTGRVLELPQDYADMRGWQALADTVARVWRDLPPEDRAQAVLIANNYGEAGALDYYGASLGLPPSIAPVGSYWYFGPGEKPADVAVIIGGDDGNRDFFREVTLAATIDEPWVVPEQRGVHVWVARGPYRTLQEVWPMFEGRN